MKAALRSLTVVLVAAAAFMSTSAASAKPASTSFEIVGYEYGFTSTVGAFAGRAKGNARDSGLWNAVVKHDRLGSTSAYVNGGSFEIGVKTASGGVDAIMGTFVHHGGRITTVDAGTDCGKQRYRVTAKLENVRTLSSSHGSGALTVKLTHYRARILGHCVAYKARVTGSVTFAY